MAGKTLIGEKAKIVLEVNPFPLRKRKGLERARFYVMVGATRFELAASCTPSIANPQECRIIKDF
ncbi:MAG: hypothetical protein ACM3MK_06800 [Chitinophagales bacterium]